MVALCHFFCVPGLGRIDNNDKERSLMMKFYLILLLAVGYMCSKAFKFEKVSRLEAVTLPFYAFWMFLANFTWNWKNVGIMCALCIVAVCLGWYQTRDAELKETTRFDKHGRPIKLLKKGKAYNIGWFLVFLVGIMLEAVAEHGIGFQMILEKLQERTCEGDGFRPLLLVFLEDCWVRSWMSATVPRYLLRRAQAIQIWWIS